MTWTLASSGTTTGTIGTEGNLVAADTTNGTYVFQPRLNNYVLGDIVEFRIYTMTLTAGVLELAWKLTVGPWAPLILTPQSPPVPSNMSIRVTMRPVAGVARATDWKLLRI
jgi:hypothetical protein